MFTGYGVYTDGTSTFINAAVCDEYYNAVNQPIVFDFPLLPNHSKTDGNFIVAFIHFNMNSLSEICIFS